MEGSLVYEYLFGFGQISYPRLVEAVVGVSL